MRARNVAFWMFVVAGAVLLPPDDADARGVPGIFSQTPGCLQFRSLALVNTCSDSVTTNIALDIQSAGAHTIDVWVKGPTLCRSEVITPDGTVTLSGWTGAGLLGNIRFNTVNVPGNGAMGVQCFLPSGAEIETIVYDD